ncbi:cytochrome c [candidate division KSB1 bacterium]|nr:cytochrome c [candidate division KSB1 bacterium]NIR71022.1 cytochrome c [candidate division KSB1 bacterium]NIS26107.1 cytochrome c [candidate division KSB1 bacterium]NIT72901.1 cytochrome c [candidate division KSB1 bacterium]NIU26746.1 cytochrome c [candidate division KSB1 bacterium]
MKRLKCSFVTIVFVVFGTAVATAQDNSDDTDWKNTPQTAFLKSEIVQTYQCTSCHTIAERGGTVGPRLNQIGNRRREEWLKRWLSDPQQVKPGTKMPKFDFSPEQLDMAVGYLTKMKKELETEQILAKDVPVVDKGDLLFEDYDCLACHRIGSTGRFVGPDLTWVGIRKTEAWEQVWLADPPAFKPDTFMPNFHIPEKGIEALAAYLHTQQGQENSESQEWEFRTNFFLGNDAKERGELVFKRFACWACHGEAGSGGIRNPNMAPNEIMPGLKKTAVNYTKEELLARLKEKTFPEPLDPNKPAPPFSCPDYGNYMEESEFGDLYAYLKSFAPKRSKWRFN